MRFEDNQELKGIYWSNESSLEVGRNGCKSIKVSMEYGQMSTVPWAIVENENGSVFKYNIALCEAVKMKGDNHES